MNRIKVLQGCVMVALLVSFEAMAQVQSPEQRMSPAEIEAQAHSGAGTGSSGVTGIQTIALKGDATKPGVYMIRLVVPAHTKIMPHDHPDDRVATVVSGTWLFGYGDQFDEAKLKALPPGSFYTEPPKQPHFAQTGDSAVVVDIAGYGPSGTHYESQSDDPMHKK
jgi:quercetin dioxygenase-like cupin family protein